MMCDIDRNQAAFLAALRNGDEQAARNCGCSPRRQGCARPDL